MNRREFAWTSAGLLAVALGPGLWSCRRPAANRKSYSFGRVREGRHAVPVTRVTPLDGEYVFAYYDVCCFSPSQRYIAATRLPFTERVPRLGDTAEVVVIDLQENSIETLYSTKTFGFQTGANPQWGGSDRYVFTNDVIGGRAVCVRIDREGGEAQAMEASMYHTAPDGSYVLGFPLEYLNITQQGYGVPSRDPENPDRLPPGASRTEGVWKTDTKTGKKRLLYSLADVAKHLPEPPPKPGGTYYFWHTKINRQGTRIMQVLRCLIPGVEGRNTTVFTLNADGSNVRYTGARPVWGQSGGHPNWHPDGDHVIRNQHVPGDPKRRFCKIRYDGSSTVALTDKVVGGGHPTIEPTERTIITDAFDERGAGTKVRLLLVDLKAGRAEAIVTMPTIDRKNLKHPTHRLDGHPVWSRDFRRVCFQATAEGRRQLFIADLGRFLG